MVPNGWKILSLGEICNNNLQTGPFGSQLHAHEYIDEGVSVVMPKDLINNQVNLNSTAKISKERANDLKKHYLKEGDLIFSRRGDVTRFALIDKLSEGSICGTGCLKATPNTNHSSKFLSYFLQKNNIKQWLEQNAVGQTMPNMNTEILSQLPLMTASSIKEEEKIVRILSTWDKAITSTENLIANSEMQKKALMQQLLTGKKRLLDENGVRFSGEWESNELQKISTITKGKQLNKSTLTKTGKYPVINGGIEPSGYSPNYNTDANTITISEGGNSCGFIGYQTTKFWCGGHCYYLSSLKINKLFLFQALKFNESKIMTLRVGSGLPNIQKRAIESYSIDYPHQINEQEKIAEVLSNADHKIELLQAKLEHLKQEKKALMQQLLTGKRRVVIN